MTTDVLSDLVTIYQTSGASVASLLNDTAASKMVIDFDASNMPRPYVILTQANYSNQYEPLGKADRVEKLICQFKVFTDTRLQCWQILDGLEALYLGTTEGLSKPSVVDKIVQKDRDKIDAWVGNFNVVYWVQQSQSYS